MRYHGFGIACALVLCGIVSCTLAPVRRAPPPDGFSETPSPQREARFPNWPVHPERFEDLMLNHARTVVDVTSAGAGTTGALKVTLSFPDQGVTLKLKWKHMPAKWSPLTGWLDGINNSPRKELAAWKIQNLFLDPDDYVVPATVALCVPIEETRRYHLGTEPMLKGSRCVLGIASLWLDDLALPDPLLDSERFDSDYVYAYFLSNLNLLTYLVKHHDGRPGNFLVSKDDARRQVFAIDNGVAFGGLFYNWFVANWNSIRVPALRRESIDRLRALTEDDVRRDLEVVAQLELNASRIYRNTEPGPNLNGDKGVRIEGDVLQLGLTNAELRSLWERIQDLITDVDEGTIAVF